jgi:hypothetical protein
MARPSESPRQPLTWVLALAACVSLGATMFAQDTQEKPVKAGETRLVVTGCLKGRVFLAVRDEEKPTEVVTGPDVVGRSFRLSGPKDVMAEVKKQNGRFVEVVGIVRTVDLARRPGVTMGNTRVTVGLAPGTDPARRNVAQDPVTNVVIMDVSSVQMISTACPIDIR